MILLINPKTTKPTEIQTDFFREPNLGILYLASILDENNISVDILDLEQYLNYDKIQLQKVIENNISTYRIFGITSLTNTFHLALNIAKIVKEKDDKNYVILGGPHVSFLYHDILKKDFKNDNLIDFICIGESEYSFLELIKILRDAIENELDLEQYEDKLNKIKGIAYTNLKGEIIFTGHSKVPIDIEVLPLPARYKLTQERYYYSVANVIVNRGCPNQCSFCSRTKLFKNVRIRSINSLLAEIRDIASLQTYNYINFYDNININDTFFEQFCEIFIDNDLKIPWGCELRVDNVSIEDAKLLKKAGCQLVATGVESASKAVLRRNFKYQDPNKVFDGISNLKEVGIPIQAYFVLGLPGETEESFLKTLNFIQKLPFDENDTINYFAATPYPGSSLWDSKSFNIKIFEKDFSKYDCNHVIFETEDLNKEKLANFYLIAKNIEKMFNSNTP